MPRIRTIKPEFFHDPDLAECSLLARLTFIGLWCYADREGRLKYDPRRLRAVLFPYDNVDLTAAIDELERGRFVHRYDVNGGHYLLIRTFTQHQVPHVRESASTLPAPDEHGASTVLAHAQPIGREGKGREGNGSGKGGGQAPAPSTPPLMGRRNEHARHAMCGQVCVPDTLWRDMVEARGGDEAYVTAYVHRVWDNLGGQTVPLDRFKFWRTQWDVDHPAPTAAELRQQRESDRLANWVPPEARGAKR